MSDQHPDGPPSDPGPGHDPVEQLTSAFPAEVEPAVRNRHLAAMDAALGTGSSPLARWLRRGGALVAALVVGVPVAAAASDDALPGDVLYPVKRATEVVVQVFDRDVVAVHRVEEAEALVERASEAITDRGSTGASGQAEQDRAADAAVDAVHATDDRSVDDELRRRALLIAARLHDLHDLGRDELEQLSTDELRRLAEELRRRQAELRAAREPEQPEPTTDASPTPRASTSPTEPTADTSPSPSPSPSPSRTTDHTTDRTTDEPTREPTGPDEPASRIERHRAGEAGVVVLEVTRAGVTLVEVQADDGWRFRADRSHEPDGVVVQFHHPGTDRNLVFTARHVGDGEVHTSTREVEGSDEPASDEPASDEPASDEPTREGPASEEPRDGAG